MTRILISLFLASLLCMAEQHARLTLSKQKAYIGEPIYATLSLEGNATEKITKMHFKPFKAEGFKVLPLPDKKSHNLHRRYILLPQRSGSMILPSQHIEIAHKDPKTYRNLWKTYRTQPLHLHILPLPEGIQTAGNYRLMSHIDHTKVKANKPVNLTVTIEGTGSLQEMQALHLPLKGPLLFESKADIHSSIAKDLYQSTYRQTFSIIADKTFTLPSLQWKYLNTDTGLIETLSTPPYQIEVEGASQNSHLLRESMFLLAGILTGVLLMLMLYTLRKRRLPHSDLSRQIRKAKTDRALYPLLLPYADQKNVAEVLKKLEENLEKKAKHPIDRAALARVLG